MKLHHVDMPKSKKPSKKMMLLFQKRARAYNSDEDEMEEDGFWCVSKMKRRVKAMTSKSELPKFTEGCRAFRTSFLNIMKKNIVIDPLVSELMIFFYWQQRTFTHSSSSFSRGQFLSAHKKLVAESLQKRRLKKGKGRVARREKHVGLH
ncbi:hypothetical protein KSP40_PGU005109 [Platanthera guangdongensis]|uniref:Uncharacterized protein n=1 Tax=Platanthera guangdongensis TaxID=2320717 RepID=A0ABR2MGS8_9ASPA